MKRKEEPNTKNVNIWSDEKKYHFNELEEKNRKNKEKIALEEKREIEMQQEKMRSREQVTFYLLFTITSLTWVSIVFAIFRWQKFPVQKHSFFVNSAYIIPCIIIWFVFCWLDMSFEKRFSDSKKNF